MDSYKLKFENGRSCTIECDSTQSFQEKINECEMRYNSECVSINGKPIKKHSLGGFLVGATIGAILGNSVPAHSVSKTTKGVKRTAKTVTRSVKKQVKKFDGGGVPKVYEVGIDEGDKGTHTIADFDSEAEAKKFMYDYQLRYPKAKLFIDSVTSDFLNSQHGGGSIDERETNIRNIIRKYSYPLTTQELKAVSDEFGYSMGDIEYVFQKMINEKQKEPKLDKPVVITFDDGFQFNEVSEQYARDNWKNKEIFGINEDEQTESLIEYEFDIDRFSVFGTEILPFEPNQNTFEEYLNEEEEILYEEVMEYLTETYPDYTDEKVGDISDEKYNEIFFEMVDSVRETFDLGVGNEQNANHFVETYMSSGKSTFAGGGSTEYNRSWHQDHARHNKAESYEMPKANRKKFAGGGILSNDEIAERMEKIQTMKSFADQVRNSPKRIGRYELEKMLPDYVSGGDISKVLAFTKSENGLQVYNLGGDAYDGGVVWEVRENGKVIEKGLIDGEWGIKFKGKDYEGLVALAKDLKAPLFVIEDNTVFQPEQMARGKKLAEGKVPRWWNKQVREYEFFVFNTETNKVWAGNEYLNDAKDELKEFKLDNPDLPLKVLSKRAITNKKINPLAYENWGRSTEVMATIRGEKFAYGGKVVSKEDSSVITGIKSKEHESQLEKTHLRPTTYDISRDPEYISRVFKSGKAYLYNFFDKYGNHYEYDELVQLSPKEENIKFADGGMSSMALAGASPQLAIADQVSQRLPATTSAIDKRMAERIYSDKPSAWEDRGLQRMATGGKIGGGITFDRYGEQRSGTITEVFADGKFAVSSGMGSYLVEPENVISYSAPEREKKGWFFADGGSTEYNRSWHQDHDRHNKGESYEVPMSDRKKFSGGGKTEQRYQILSPDGFPLFRDRTFTESEILPAFEEWKKRYEKQGYYSTSNRERIDLRDLADMVDVIEVSDDYLED